MHVVVAFFGAPLKCLVAVHDKLALAIAAAERLFFWHFIVLS
jgi:hypothetical protein